jgi:hypothetical protein
MEERNARVKNHNFHPLSNYLMTKVAWKSAICFSRITMNIMQQKDWFKDKDQLKEGKLQLDEKMQGNSCGLFQCNFSF